MQHIEHLGQHTAPVRSLLGQMAHCFKQGSGITLEQRLQHAIDLAMIECAEHSAHIRSQHFAFTKGNSLVGQAHGVAHRAVGCAPQQPQGIVFKGYVFGAEHMAQVLDHPLGGHVLQRELQAA
ncbi:hypothetical protein D3C79_676770 [compost metagenome]